MNKEQIVDEIDWLIFELKPGLKLSVEHYASFEAVDIDCQHDTMSRYQVDSMTKVLKNKREKLI